MRPKQTVISLDPIDQKKDLGFLGRLLITRWSGGSPIVKMDKFGHYMFCGPQGASKTSSALWYAEQLTKRYTRRYFPKRITYYDNEQQKFVRFTDPPTVKHYSNFGVFENIDKTAIFDTIDGFDPYANEVRIIILDEIHTYFPKDGGSDKQTVQIRNDLISIFSQLRKRNTYILSTAQVYGRLHKALREQCLFMVNCSTTLSNKLKNEFIPGDDIICDDLGRWAGRPKRIYVHGLANVRFDTKRVVRE